VLGHSNINKTAVYLRLNDQDLQDVYANVQFLSTLKQRGHTIVYHIGQSKWRAMYIRRQRKERSRWRAVWDKGVRHEVQICVYCGGNGDIDLAVCPQCFEKRKEARKRFYNLFKKRYYAS
jgi:hypothetical protein